MATLRYRRGRWEAQVRRQGFPQAIRSFEKRADAERWARHLEAEAERTGLPPDRGELKRQPLRLLLDRYETEISPKKRGHEVEKIILKGLANSNLGRLVLSALTPEVIAKHRDDRLKIVTPSTVLRELAVLQHVLTVARREWNVPLAINPVSLIKKPAPNRPRDRRVTADELGLLRDALAESRNKTIKSIIRLALATGMRRGELLRLRWADIDREARTLHIPITKNGIPRTIPLSPEALKALDEAPRLNTDLVFPTSANALRLAWVRLIKRAKVQDLHFHDLRHEAISRFFERGLSVPEVALISGHRDPRMLFRYTHLRAEDIAMKLAGGKNGAS
jgi:integrase